MINKPSANEIVQDNVPKGGDGINDINDHIKNGSQMMLVQVVQPTQVVAPQTW
jgi:hypothetical protein